MDPPGRIRDATDEGPAYGRQGAATGGELGPSKMVDQLGAWRSPSQRSKHAVWSRFTTAVAVKPSTMLSSHAKTSPQALHRVPLPGPRHSLIMRPFGRRLSASFCWMKSRRTWPTRGY